MNIQTQEVLKTMAYVNNKNFAYELPSTYLNPILELIDKYGRVDDVTFKLHKPTVISNNTTDRIVAYPRLVLEAPLNIRDNEKQMIVAFLYALDNSKNPLFMSAIGTEIFSCTNLTLVGDTSVAKSNTYDKALLSITEQLANAKMYQEQFELFRYEAEKTILSVEAVKEFLGDLILCNLRNKEKALNDYITEGFDEVLNETESVYYQSADYNKWNLFNSTTQAITNKAKAFNTRYFDRLSPTRKLYDLFNTVK